MCVCVCVCVCGESEKIVSAKWVSLFQFYLNWFVVPLKHFTKRQNRILDIVSKFKAFADGRNIVGWGREQGERREYLYQHVIPFLKMLKDVQFSNLLSGHAFHFIIYYQTTKFQTCPNWKKLQTIF